MTPAAVGEQPPDDRLWTQNLCTEADILRTELQDGESCRLQL
jgi:hypothetical protein